METIICPICGYPKAENQVQYDPMTIFYMCPICGRYEFSETEMIRPSLDKKKLGAFLYYKGFRRKNDWSVEYRYHTTLSKEKCDEYVAEFKSGNNTHGHPVHMDNDIINSWYPRSFAEKVNMILIKLDEIADYIGQEINITTYNLCRINMFLHDIGFDKFDIECEDTLTNPQHWDDEPFELIVSNPPYSIKWEGDENPLLINDPRFAPAGVLAPKGKADMAFIMHSLSWLAPNGTAAIVCFPGIMYRGGAEQKIRRYLIENNFIDCVIQLPANLFFGTTIATCIMVLKRGKKDNKTLFIDATNECIKVTNNNKLTNDNIDRIVEIYTNRESIDHISYLASFEEIEEKDFNLLISSYVVAEDKKNDVDIEKINTRVAELTKKVNMLRLEVDDIVAEIRRAQDE